MVSQITNLDVGRRSFWGKFIFQSFLFFNRNHKHKMNNHWRHLSLKGSSDRLKLYAKFNSDILLKISSARLMVKQTLKTNPWKSLFPADKLVLDGFSEGRQCSSVLPATWEQKSTHLQVLSEMAVHAFS